VSEPAIKQLDDILSKMALSWNERLLLVVVRMYDWNASGSKKVHSFLAEKTSLHRETACRTLAKVIEKGWVRA